MSLLAARLLRLLARPSSLILPILLIGCLGLQTRFHEAAGLLLLLTVLALLLVTLLPVGLWLTRPLEDRFPKPARYPPRVDGVIVLGNGPDGALTAARDEPALRGPAARLAALVELGRVFPEARLVFSGGIPKREAHGLSEAGAARLFYERQGFASQRILFEDAARTTRENALNVLALVRPQKGERWLLVTSAWAMPRAVGTFRRAGLDPLAWPVDYLTPGPVGLTLSFNLPRRLGELDRAAHEWLGLLVYRVRGWTGDLYPGPRA